MEIIQEIEELRFKNSKCYGIIKLENGKEYGFTLKGDITAKLLMKRDRDLYETTETAIIDIASINKTGESLFEIYDLNEFFMKEMEKNA